MSVLTVGGMFDGAGLLALGLHQAGLRHAWLCERDEWRARLLERRFGVRVLRDVGDVGAVRCEPVDVIAGGFPCKGVSTAGLRNGFGHPETVLWREMARAVGELRPRFVVVENVANLLALHDGKLWGEVLGDLVALGFDVEWDVIPAAAFGAPHLRERVVAIASHPSRQPERAAHDEADAEPGERVARQVPRGGDPELAADAGSNGVRPQPLSLGERGGTALAARAGAAPADANGTGRLSELNGSAEPVRAELAGAAGAGGVSVGWGIYEPAIRRWEAVHGPAPEPLVRRLDDGDPALRRVRARVDRQRLSALGDGVHVYLGRLLGERLMEMAA